MRQAIPKMASVRSVGSFTSLPNRPRDVSSVFRSRRTVVQSRMGGFGFFFRATKCRLLHSKTATSAMDNEYSSRKLTHSSQVVQFGGEDFVARLLDRRWALANPESKINKVILLTADTNLEGSPANHLCLAVDTNICTYNDLSRANASEQSFYVVRDDLLHPLINGNKARKLDGFLPLIEDNLVTDVVTCGGCQSAHAAATERGLRSHLLLRGEQPELLTGYNLMSTIYGNVTYVPRSIYANREKMLKTQAELVAGSSGSILWFDDVFQSSIMKQPCSTTNSVPVDYDFHIRARKHERKVIVINEGAGDSIALLGLIRLVNYLSQDHLLGKQRAIKFVIDAGTGTTAIGLGLGALCLGLPWEVTAVMLADRIDGYKRQEKRLISEFKKHFGYPVGVGLGEDEVNGGIVNWVERFRPRKFGNVLDGEVEICKQIAQETGILVDPIYTLAAWEMATFLSQKGAKVKADVVMLHTGGTLGMFGIAQRYKSYFNNLKNV
ncbi:D-cysteine desulfhydrase 2, mitochondrial isoform X2 [Cucurbita pepo subsp. pepo]|uniref:D-cysteine desulfhydrase 2, mitochondrial isoform X2 n=1 Tax=Cucurbita pepo subsp. pepo TaxID=3664 RepID=UPI000C9D9657|nr:D-cysteine desulfhydrase 2, mitochondrial isoform X2 [Cucurbita pepo subsp. pepo]